MWVRPLCLVLYHIKIHNSCSSRLNLTSVNTRLLCFALVTFSCSMYKLYKRARQLTELESQRDNLQSKEKKKSNRQHEKKYRRDVAAPRRSEIIQSPQIVSALIAGEGGREYEFKVDEMLGATCEESFVYVWLLWLSTIFRARHGLFHINIRIRDGGKLIPFFFFFPSGRRRGFRADKSSVWNFINFLSVITFKRNWHFLLFSFCAINLLLPHSISLFSHNLLSAVV